MNALSPGSLPAEAGCSNISSAVALLVFNRPEVTARVFAEVRRARPPVLLVVADGPRADRAGEAEQCREVRRIATAVDWPCELLTNFADENLGCKARVSSGIDWVFTHVEQAIILEDDCLPHPTFFRFCDEMLEKYREDQRVFMVSGNNFQSGLHRDQYSYYFSRYAHIWGWATWRRAWRHYDVSLKLWPEIRDGHWLNDILDGDSEQVSYWTRVFQAVAEGSFNTWDYQWTFAAWINSALTILPNCNLVSNIGFGTEATHTTATDTPLANMPAVAMKWPMAHPPFVIQNRHLDKRTFRSVFRSPGLVRRMGRKLRRILRS